MTASGPRGLTLASGLALAGVVVWHARRVEAPAIELAPSEGPIETVRREAFSFLRVPERVEIDAPTLRRPTFESVPGAAPSAKAVAARDPSAGGRDPFFPSWYAGAPPAAAVASPSRGPAPAMTPAPPIARAAAPTAPGKTVAAEDRPLRFSGTIVLQNGKPAAVVKDTTSGENVLLSEGESYRGVLLVQLDFFSATFASPTGTIYRFSAVVGGDKTFPAGDGEAARASNAARSEDSPGGGVAERSNRGE